MSLIFVVSVQHTGSWFTIEACVASPDIKEVFMLTRTPHVQIEAMRNHVRKFVFHDHFSTSYHDTHLVSPIAVDCPIVMPLRDPLLALITRQSRAPELEHAYIVMGIMEIMTIIEKYNVFLLPVDIPRSEVERIAVLSAMYTFVGLTKPAKLKGYAAKWKPHNTTAAMTPDKVARRKKLGSVYDQRDYATLKKLIPISLWVLEQVQPRLQPFMESVGYEDLMWFK